MGALRKGVQDEMVEFSTTFHAPARPRIVVQLARLDLDSGERGTPEILSPADRGREEFLAGRRALRAHLAALLGCAPADVPLRVDGSGRLVVAGGDLHVSVSRSEGWLAVATSRDCPIGVDVEAVRPLPHLGTVVDELLPRRGRAAVLAAAPADRVAVFLRWWTRIEAAVKACGGSLDAAPACLAAAPQVTCDIAPGLALAAAAAVPDARPSVEWRWPGTSR
ncbi:MAG TPA: 4'-phosphopantetheinyl transferase superfamily protein [Candidatus Dormibacteraeota bacterium]